MKTYLLLAGLAAMVIGGWIMSQPRGIRNNNPGNLRITGIDWNGKVPVAQNTDGAFEQFKSWKGYPGHIWGIRAMFKDVRGDIERDGLLTIRQLINAYAPPSENNTSAYVNSVSTQVGIGPDEPIAADHYLALLKAIIKHENGQQPYSDADIATAMALA